MFNSIDPFQHLPFPFHQSPPFIAHESDDIFFQQHNDLLVGHFSPASTALAEAVINVAVSNNPTITNQDIHRTNQESYPPSNFLQVKRAVKKDRHSKITTAHGPRERRVRLSIKIARKFFDLQDLLGFDKASKTLEWLLAKSKTAIKEVAQIKDSCKEGAKSLSSGINYEAAESEDPREILFERKYPGGVSKQKNMKVSTNAAFHLLARESRAKARARARERTRKKLCTRARDEMKKFAHSNQHVICQSRSSSQFETYEKLGSHSHNMTSSLKVLAQVEEPSSHLLANHAPREDIIEKSIVMKRKLKPSPFLGCQQNLAFSKDLTLNNSNTHSPNLPQNWDDINGGLTHSSFCAMTNMNLSAEFQMFGYNNLSLH